MSTAAAVDACICGGSGTIHCAGTATRSAYPPETPGQPQPTRSPTVTPLTWDPTDETTPAASWPGMNGSGSGIRPALFVMSAKLTPLAATSTTTSPGPGSGSGSSAMASTSGPPFSDTIIARIGRPASFRRRQVACPADRNGVLPDTRPPGLVGVVPVSDAGLLK